MSLSAMTMSSWRAAGCLYLLYAGWVTRRFAARAPRRMDQLPPASILKPLCGEDPDLYENLASFCRQDYPAFQVVFGVQDPADPAIAVVRRLMAEFPGRDLTLVVEGGQDSGNPAFLRIARFRSRIPKWLKSLN